MREELSKNIVRCAPIVRGVFSRQVCVESNGAISLSQSLPSQESTDQELYRSLAVSALNLVPMGVILTDENCRAILVNRAAENILVEHDGLKLHRHIVAASSSRETRALRKLVTNATHLVPSEKATSCAAMTVSRSSFRRPYEIVVIGISVRGLVRGPAAMAAVIFIGQQDVEASTVEPVIAGLYGLTRAESRLAALLMRGKTLSQVSSDLQITRETARTHLRNIFAKTQTNRQSELVRLLVAGPSNVCLRN